MGFVMGVSFKGYRMSLKALDEIEILYVCSGDVLKSGLLVCDCCILEAVIDEWGCFKASADGIKGLYVCRSDDFKWSVCFGGVCLTVVMVLEDCVYTLFICRGVYEGF